MAIYLDFPKNGETISFLTAAQREFIAAESERAQAIGGEIDYLHLFCSGTDQSQPEDGVCRFCAQGDSFSVLFAPEGYTPLLVPARGNTVRIPYLPIGVRVTWQVFSDEMGGDCSDVGYFYTAAEPVRFIRVPGITNVRDCGIWKTGDSGRMRQGMVFRGSEWDSHCHLTSEGKRVLIEEMHLRTELDMRGESKAEEPGVLEDDGVQRIRIPLVPYDEIFTHEAMEAYGAYFQLFSEPALYPCYLHCWGGADRTGTLVYLLQTFLGVSRSDAVLDYELTTMSVWGVRYRRFTPFADMEKHLRDWYGTDGVDMQTCVHRFLLDCGVHERELSMVRALLLENVENGIDTGIHEYTNK